MRLSEIDPDKHGCLEDLVIWGTTPLSSTLSLLDEMLDDHLDENNPEDCKVRTQVNWAMNGVADLTDAIYRFERPRRKGIPADVA